MLRVALSSPLSAIRRGVRSIHTGTAHYPGFAFLSITYSQTVEKETRTVYDIARSQGSSISPGIVGTLLDSLNEAIVFLKRTFQPSLLRRKRKHGYLARAQTKDGRAILNHRRRKGRKNLCA
mmetsp:Transcript_9832/g.21885  ORF Transcript_9832/g.21885 Transcript_9832/m.21885 type:complete len:122 (+) Transcript_9832:165-530(+)